MFLKSILSLFLLISFPTFSNDNVQNRDGVYYDILTNKKYTGNYVNKYIHETMSINGEIKWTYSYRYKIPMKNGVRHGIATLYKSILGVYSDSDSEYKRVDSYKDVEVSFNMGKVLFIKEYDLDGSLSSVTSFNNGKAKTYTQNTGELIREFTYIEDGDLNPPMKKIRGYYLFMGDAYAIDGKEITYKSGGGTTTYTYKNNVKHGPFVSTHSKSQVFQQGQYSNGKMDGDYKLYCEDGRLGQHLTYLAGEIVEKIIDNGDDYCYSWR